jgi:Glycosyl hydrolase family 26
LTIRLGHIKGSTTISGLSVRREPHKARRASDPGSSPVPSVPASTLVGWSGNAIPGLQQQIIGTWMARSTWTNLAQGQWMAFNSEYRAYVAKDPGGAADVGVPLIPTDEGVAFNKLLDVTISGAQDATYRSMGAELATNGPATVYARLFWEMNQWTYTMDPSKFQAAWIHAVPLIREGFSSVARPGQKLFIVFSPISDGKDFTEFYPGDNFVDVIAPDVYGTIWGTTEPAASTLLTVIKRYLYTYSAFAAAHHKPVGLGEWGNMSVQPQGKPSSQGRGDFPGYVDLVLAWAAKMHAAYLVYFNLPDAGVGQTLSNTPNSLRDMTEAVDHTTS